MRRALTRWLASDSPGELVVPAEVKAVIDETHAAAVKVQGFVCITQMEIAANDCLASMRQAAALRGDELTNMLNAQAQIDCAANIRRIKFAMYQPFKLEPQRKK